MLPAWPIKFGCFSDLKLVNGFLTIHIDSLDETKINIFLSELEFGTIMFARADDFTTTNICPVYDTV